jgi:hypothetical protein
MGPGRCWTSLRHVSRCHRRRQRRHPPRWPKHLPMFRGNLMSEPYIWRPDGQADRPACAPWRGRRMLRVDDAPRVSSPGERLVDPYGH